MNGLDMVKYLGDDWKNFRDGESWTDIGLLKEKLIKDDKWEKFYHYSYKVYCSSLSELQEYKTSDLVDWLFTPERFCNLVIAYWDMEK